MLGSSRVAAQLAAPQEGLSSVSERTSAAYQHFGNKIITQTEFPSTQKLEAGRNGILQDIVFTSPIFIQL
jgi:hypothetical protein